MILINLNKQINKPLFVQIVEQLQQLITSGDLQVGEKLPSTRKLAETLGVHRTTVYRAYEELWALGYLEAITGGYSRVRQRTQLVNKAPEDSSDMFKWNDRLSESVKLLENLGETPTVQSYDVIDFRPLSPDSDLLPTEDFRKCMNQVLHEEGVGILQYGKSGGYYPLREYLARQMRQHGIRVEADEIILSNGMQNGIEMVMRLLTNPGDLVVTESPTYSSAIILMKYLGLEIICIPVNEDGMDLNALESELKRQRVKLIYSMPTFHNPTGISTSQAHRERLLKLCDKYQVPLVEDGFEEEMKYFGKAVLPVKSMDRKQMVIYLGTFSKVLFPGVRIGWIAASRQLSQRLPLLKQVSSLSDSQVTHAAVHRFCEQGLYELHKKRLHRAYRKRMQVALAACREFLPVDLVQFTKPEGGYLIWLTLNWPVSDEKKINDLLVQNGVALTPGSRFFSVLPKQVHFRISIAHRKEDEIKEGIKRIGDIFKSFKSHDIN